MEFSETEWARRASGNLFQAALSAARGPGGVWSLTLTPLLASAFLSCVPKYQRARDTRAVVKYAADMRAHAWADLVADIGLTTDGELVQGQHTCAAVVESGMSVCITLKAGLSKSAWNVLDGHRARTLAFRTGKSAYLVAALTSLAGLESNSLLRMTPSGLDTVAQRNTAWIDAVGVDTAVKSRGFFAGFLGALWFAAPVFTPDNPSLASLVEQLTTGCNIAAGSPSYQLRSWAERHKSSNSTDKEFAACNAIVSYLRGEPLKSIHVTSAGYRYICTKRRVARVPFTPDAESAPTLSK